MYPDYQNPYRFADREDAAIADAIKEADLPKVEKDTAAEAQAKADSD